MNLTSLNALSIRNSNVVPPSNRILGWGLGTATICPVLKPSMCLSRGATSSGRYRTVRWVELEGDVTSTPGPYPSCSTIFVHEVVEGRTRRPGLVMHYCQFDDYVVVLGSSVAGIGNRGLEGIGVAHLLSLPFAADSGAYKNQCGEAIPASSHRRAESDAFRNSGACNFGLEVSLVVNNPQPLMDGKERD